MCNRKDWLQIDLDPVILKAISWNRKLKSPNKPEMQDTAGLDY